MHHTATNENVINIPYVLDQILIKVRYNNDRERFITTFLTIIYTEVIEQLGQSLDPNRRQDFFASWNSLADSPVEMEKMFLSFFTDEQINSATNTIAHKKIIEYLESIQKSITIETYNDVLELTNTLKTN